MPKARRSSYNMAFKLKAVAEAEAVENNSEIAREYGLSESMVRLYTSNIIICSVSLILTWLQADHRICVTFP